MKHLYTLFALFMAVSLQGAQDEKHNLELPLYMRNEKFASDVQLVALLKRNKNVPHRFKPRKLKVKPAALQATISARCIAALKAAQYIAARRGKGEADQHPAAAAAYAPESVLGYIRYPYHPKTPHEFRHYSGDGYPCKKCILPDDFNPNRLGTKP